MDTLLSALHDSAPAAALRSSFAAYPLVNALHVLGAGGLVVLVWLMHAALAGREGLAGEAAARLLRRLVLVAIAGMIVTGFALFSVKPRDYAANPAFLVKLALIALALANAAAYHAVVSRRPGMARISMIVSVAAWPAILLAGRFVGFV